MHSFDYRAYTYDGACYCTRCLPEEIDESGEDVHPIFADSEWDHYPVCDICGEEHDYVTLTIYGLRARAERWEGEEIQRMRAESPTDDLPLHAEGSPLVYLAGKGLEPVCPKCANKRRYKYAEWEDDAIKAYYIHWEGAPEYCENCGAEIESAYGDPEAAQTDEA